jgi:hypothetical protein
MEYKRIQEKWEISNNKFNKEVAILQSKCPHENKSEWIEVWWAPRHSSGYQIKECLDCNKQIDKR